LTGALAAAAGFDGGVTGATVFERDALSDATG